MSRSSGQGEGHRRKMRLRAVCLRLKGNLVTVIIDDNDIISTSANTCGVYVCYFWAISGGWLRRPPDDASTWRCTTSPRWRHRPHVAMTSSAAFPGPPRRRSVVAWPWYATSRRAARQTSVAAQGESGTLMSPMGVGSKSPWQPP